MTDAFTYTLPVTTDIPVVRLPRSKSIGARNLVLKAVAGERNLHADSSDCRDLQVMAKALATLCQSAQTGVHTEINLDESGTALRFLTAFAAALPDADVTLRGNGRLECRTIAPLVEALRGMGAQIKYLVREGYAPVLIRGKKLSWHPCYGLGKLSSQFISALMLIAPLLGVSANDISIPAGIPSRPYAEMTLRMASDPRRRRDEGDWSAAAFIFEYVALSGRSVRVENFPPKSTLQGDRVVARLFARLGVRVRREARGVAMIERIHSELPAKLCVNMRACPDLVPPFGVAAALAGVCVRIKGIENLRHKESNRIDALTAGLVRLGVKCEWYERDGGTLEMRKVESSSLVPVICSHADHRMVMAFVCALPALPKGVAMRITDSGCVDKSYPHFLHDMNRLGIKIMKSE